MAGTIGFTGMSTGQDMNQVIDALVSARRAGRITPYENWKYTWEDKIDLINEIDLKLAAFYTQAKSMDRISEFMVRTADSADDSVVSASAGSSAVTGAYTVEVGSSIKHRLGSDGKVDADTTAYALNGDQLQITVGASSETITLNGGDYTLAGIAAEIQAESGLVDAEVIDDGSTSQPYRLVLTARSGGSANAVTIGTNDTTVDFSMSAAGDRIDAVETGTWTGTSAAASGGQYLGSVNKTFHFEVTSQGANQVVGTDDITLHWTDSQGNEGDLNFDGAYAPAGLTTVFQGLQVSLGAGDVNAGDTFSIDVWHPDLQQAQDDGLAKVEKEVHTGFADQDTTAVTLTEQTFSYTYNGQERSLTVGAGTTLTELKNLINSDTQNPGIRANILNDGSGLATAFHLVLSGDQTGAAHRISVISHTLDNFDAGFAETQSAQNAMLKVDNYPAGDEYIQKTDNTVTDVIPGLTLTLADTGTVTISVGTDKDAIIESAQAFADAFNEVRSVLKEAMRYGGGQEQSGLLLGNYALQIVKSRLDGLVTGTSPGFEEGVDTYVNLQQLGFNTDVEEGSATQGLLVLDTTALGDALDEDADAVAQVFAAYFEGATDSTQITFANSLSTATPGTYTVEIDTGTEQGRFKLEDGTWGDWYDMTGSSGNYSLTGSSGPERGIALSISHTAGSGTHTTDMRLKNGTITELSREMETLLSTSGPLNTLVENYNHIIDNIEDRIEAEERRLTLYEERLIQSYARLDAYVGRMTSMGDMLSQMGSSLSSAQ